MKIHKLLRIILVVGLVGLFGCGGGGSSSTPPPSTPPAKATTTLSGKVEFPSLSSLVAKRVNAAGDPILVRAFTIDGVAAGSQVTADGTGAFTIPGLVPGTDYVIKATRGTQILKKLVEKSLVAPDATVSDQNLSDVSTTAVAVASQKLAETSGITKFSLGEPVTVALTDLQKTTLSEEIFTKVSPADLELTISDAKTKAEAAIQSGDYSAMTAALANLVNTLNIVVAAVSTNNDPTKVLNGDVTSFAVPANAPKELKLFSADSTTGVISQTQPALTSVTTAQIVQQVTSSVDTYVPPSRVQLEISTNVAVGTLYGVTFDITVPADVQVKLTNPPLPSIDGLSYSVDMKSVIIATGVITGTLSEAQYTPSTRKLRVLIVGQGAASSLPTGKLFSVVFDRTAGKAVSASDFAISYTPVDLDGQLLQTGFTIIKTAISSGL